MSNNVKGALLTLSGGICWGLSGSMGQYLFDRQGMDARWLVPIRLFLAGLILFIYCFFKYRDKLFGIWKSPRAAGMLLVYGLAGVSMSQYTYFRCPTCGQQMRIPRGVGKVKITCKGCSSEFEMKG